MDIIEMGNVVYTYPGRAELALDTVSIHLPTGCKIAFLGCNGSSKSTLFLHCNGILKHRSSAVRFMGEGMSDLASGDNLAPMWLF
ncbi:MAG: hypothetical protein JXB07_20610 [Anaerolineae bacterium]|nr:hypothetical protein [Anaerolineae bacterium]